MAGDAAEAVSLDPQAIRRPLAVPRRLVPTVPHRLAHTVLLPGPRRVLMRRSAERRLSAGQHNAPAAVTHSARQLRAGNGTAAVVTHNARRVRTRVGTAVVRPIGPVAARGIVLRPANWVIFSTCRPRVGRAVLPVIDRRNCPRTGAPGALRVSVAREVLVDPEASVTQVASPPVRSASPVRMPSDVIVHRSFLPAGTATVGTVTATIARTMSET